MVLASFKLVADGKKGYAFQEISQHPFIDSYAKIETWELMSSRNKAVP